MTAITFPRAWPGDLKLVGMSFTPEPMVELTPTRSGSIIAKDLGPTLWKAHYQSRPCAEAEFGALRAWYSTLTSVESFYGHDVLREYPLAYPGGLDGFAGSCGIDGVTDSKLVALAELPVGYVASPGDFLAFDYGANNSRALHMIVAGGTARGSGDLEVEVRPSVRTGWSAAATPAVTLYQASAEMIIRPGSYRESVDASRAGTISFDAIQRL